jgi:hypothetical protein
MECCACSHVGMSMTSACVPAGQRIMAVLSIILMVQPLLLSNDNHDAKQTVRTKAACTPDVLGRRRASSCTHPPSHTAPSGAPPSLRQSSVYHDLPQAVYRSRQRNEHVVQLTTCLSSSMRDCIYCIHCSSDSAPQSQSTSDSPSHVVPGKSSVLCALFAGSAAIGPLAYGVTLVLALLTSCGAGYTASAHATKCANQPPICTSWDV